MKNNRLALVTDNMMALGDDNVMERLTTLTPRVIIPTLQRGNAVGNAPTLHNTQFS